MDARVGILALDRGGERGEIERKKDRFRRTQADSRWFSLVHMWLPENSVLVLLPLHIYHELYIYSSFCIYLTGYWLQLGYLWVGMWPMRSASPRMASATS